MTESKGEKIITVDYWRQLDLFSPEKFGDQEVHVIGLGATGSYVMLLLAKMGVRRLHGYDFDIVENHNLPNQVFRLRDVGRPKTQALAEIIKEQTGTEITVHEQKVDGTAKLKGIVFLLVDTMDARQQIWDGAIRMNAAIDLMVETRLAIDNGRIYAIRPFYPAEIKLWEETLYSDDEAEQSPCTSRSIAPTVALIASLAVWKLIKHANGEEYEPELIISARPATIISSAALAGV